MRQNEPEEYRKVVTALASLRKQGATSANHICFVCGVVVRDIPLKDVPSFVFDPCVFCGATYREKQRVKLARMN